MKKVMLIILTIVLAVFLISCSNGKNTPAQTQEQTNTPDAPTTSTEEVAPTEVTTASTAATEPVYTQTPPVPQTPVAVVGGSVDLGPEYADGDYCVYSATVYGENGNYAGSFALSYLKFVGYSSEAMFGNLGLDFGCEDGYKLKVGVKNADGTYLYRSDSDFGKQYIAKEDDSSSEDGFICNRDKLYGFSMEVPELMKEGENHLTLEIEVYNSKDEKIAQSLNLSLTVKLG